MAALHVPEVRIQAEEVQPAFDGRPEAKSNIDGDGNGALPSEAELARLGYVKMTAQAHSAPLEFSGGLLPESAQADTYEDASKQVQIVVGGVRFSAGLFYIKGAGLQLGMDTNTRELREPAFYRAVMAEFVGTLFFLFFSIATIVYRTDFAGGAVKPSRADADTKDFVDLVGTVGSAAQLMIASIFGIMIMVLVYGLAPVSGGHINPAVSFGLMLTKRITVIRAVAYIIAQSGGAILGTLIAASLSHDTYKRAGGGVNGSSHYGARELVVAEIMGTALLMFVVYAALDPLRAGKVIHIGALGPAAIGAAVFAAHLALLPIDGTSINPARSLGPAVVYGQWKQHWCFWVGPLIGAAVSACFYELCLKGRPEKPRDKAAKAQ